MILVDDRTGSAELEPLIQTTTAVVRLEYADFSWVGWGPTGPAIIGVERKTIMDLISSMISGRLSGHQMVGLMADYDWVYLLVEGQWKADTAGGLQNLTTWNRWVKVKIGKREFKMADIYNFLNTLTVMCGAVIVRTSTPQETALWLDGTYRWWQKGWEEHKSHSQFQIREGFVSLQKPTLVTRVAKEFAGVGWGKARVIGKKYRTMQGLMNADMKGLMDVDGIGKVLAKSIVREVEGDEN